MKWFIIKFAVVLAIMAIAFGVQSMPFIQILFFALLFTGISFVGDLLFLPRYGNLAATVIDAGLAMIIVLMASRFLIGGLLIVSLTAVLVAGFIGIAESIFHQFFAKSFFNDEVKEEDKHFTMATDYEMQTEFSSEFSVDQKDLEEGKRNKKYVPYRKRKRNKKNPY